MRHDRSHHRKANYFSGVLIDTLRVQNVSLLSARLLCQQLRTQTRQPIFHRSQPYLWAVLDLFLCNNINMQYIILKLRSSTINILILFLPEIYAVLITKLNMHFYGPINKMLNFEVYTSEELQMLGQTIEGMKSKNASHNSKIMFRTKFTAKPISHSNCFSPLLQKKAYNFGSKPFKRNP